MILWKKITFTAFLAAGLFFIFASFQQSKKHN